MKVDAKIRRIKEVYRSVKSGLQWKSPNTLVKDLVAYAVARLNIFRTTALTQNVCPKVLFTGVKINYKKELELGFGDYCEVYDGTDNTSKIRSIPCIALYPCNSSTGSWEFLNLQTRQRVRRSNWKLMATSELIIDTMNCFENEKSLPLAPEIAVRPETESTVEENKEDMPVEEPAILLEDLEEPPALVDAPDSDNEEENNDSEESAETELEPAIATRTRQRSGAVIKPPERYTLASKKVYKSRETPERIKKIEEAEKADIELLFVDLQSLLPVYEQKEADNCHVFSVEKTLANGEHDKFKARLVFDGSEQDAELFPEKSSPTVAISHPDA